MANTNPQVVFQPRRSGFQRGVWLLDAYGRGATLVTLAAAGGAVGGVTIGVVRAVSKLPPWPWLFILWASAGVLVFLLALIAVLGTVGGRLISSDPGESCWLLRGIADGIGSLEGQILVTNTDPTWVLHPTRVRARRVRSEKTKIKVPLEAFFMLLPPDKEPWPIEPGKTQPYRVVFRGIPSQQAATRSVEARVDFRDQFQRWHNGRGRIEFVVPPYLGTPASAPASTPSDDDT